jgi:hypothetical protein
MSFIEPVRIVFGRQCHICNKGGLIVPVVNNRVKGQPVLMGGRCNVCQTMFHHPYSFMDLLEIGDVEYQQLDGENKYLPADGKCPVHADEVTYETLGWLEGNQGDYEFCSVCFWLLKAPEPEEDEQTEHRC